MEKNYLVIMPGCSNCFEVETFVISFEPLKPENSSTTNGYAVLGHLRKRLNEISFGNINGGRQI